MISQRPKPDKFLLIIAPVLVFLLFWNLGNQYLWYDEAQTAVLARSVLEHGYPRALIGDFLVSTDETYGPGTSYIAQPWLQNYVCAVPFLLFGESNASARIMFVLFGFLSFYLLYALSYRLFKDRLIARLTLLVAGTSVPFLLHLRQCRYYSLTVFLTLVLLIAYLKFLEKEKYSSALFIGASFLLFHANFGCVIPLLIALFVHFFFFEKKRLLAKKFVSLYVWTFFLILPWAVIYKIWEQGAGDPMASILRNANFYLRKINRYFFPYRFLAIALLAIFAIKRKFKFSTAKTGKDALIFLVLIIGINWVFLWFVDYNSARYIIHIAVLFFMLSAFLLARVFVWNKVIGVLLILALCFSDLLNTSLFSIALKPVAPVASLTSAWARQKGLISASFNKKINKELNELKGKPGVKTYFFDYIYEITHDYDGPIEGVVKYLEQNAKPGQTIKTHDFSANPLFFYTDLEIDADFTKRTFPEWIFLRNYWIEDSFYDSAYFKKIEKRYEKIELDYPDIWWENRPDDLSFHHFKTAPLDKKISLYRRR